MSTAEPNWPAIDQAINILNEAMEDDPLAMDALLRIRIRCNRKLADHPTIQCFVSTGKNDEITDCYMSPFGLINGLFGADAEHWAHIAAYTDQTTGKLVRFGRAKEVREAEGTL